MRRFIFSLLNLYIYSSVHIGLCTASLVYLNYQAFELPVNYEYCYFSFFATVMLYNIHRIVGIRKLAAVARTERFDTINSYRNHILVYALVAGCCAGWLLVKLPSKTWIQLGLPIVISGLYSLPLLSANRRLRDFNYLKIFLIAIIWALVTLAIPLADYNESLGIITLLSLERALFIFSITLPFDWRDQDIDRNAGVATLVHVLGKSKSLFLSLALMVLNVGILLFLFSGGIISFKYLVSLVVSYLIAAIIIGSFRNSESDYVYSGLIDGTMLLPLGLYLII